MPINPVVAQLIMSQKAPDIYGQYQKGQVYGNTMRDLETKRLRETEEQERQKQTRALMGKALSGQFAEGSDMQSLAIADPQAAVQLSKFLNVPIDSSGRFKAFGDNVKFARELGKEDHLLAFEHMSKYAQRLNMMGVNPKQTNEWLSDYTENPEEAMKELENVDNAFNRVYGTAEKEKKTDDMLNAEAIAGPPGTPEYKKILTALTEKDKRTQSIKEYEYGVKNPGFVINKKKKEEAKKIEALQKQKFNDSNILRKEYLKESIDFRKGRDAYNRVVASAEKADAPGDMALIFNYMKVLDPGSTVREGEFAQVAKTGAFGEIIQAAMGKLSTGKRLSDSQRAKFVNRSKMLYKASEKQNDQRKKTYTRLATKNKLDPNDIVVDIEAVEKEEQPGDIPTINTQQEFDALPSGATYYDEGVEYRKP